MPKKPVQAMEINWEEIEGMAQRFSPPDEIRQCLGLTEIQFRRAIRTHYKKSIDQWWGKYAAQGRYILRQKQFEEARQGSITALKWLGIQHLGQRAHVEETLFNPGEKKDDKEKAEEVKGFAILTPEGMERSNGGDLKGSQPHDEVPVVQELIKKELEDDSTKEPDQEHQPVEVPGFPEAHEA